MALRQLPTQKLAAGLVSARELGRQSMQLGLGATEVALLHERIMASLMPSLTAATARAQLLKRSGPFLAEVIRPLDAARGAALQAGAHLKQLNQSLKRRTCELAASNRLLKREVARRQKGEETLRRSEQRAIALLEESRLLQAQLRLLSHRILSTQEDERKRISRELHDVIAQVLTGIHVQLANLKLAATATTKEMNLLVSRAQRLVEKTVDSVHRFACELRPTVLDDLGLVPALHSFLKTFTKDTGVRAHLSASAGLEELSSAKRTALFRVAQEALVNVARHAKASRVDISILKRMNSVCMLVKDDGQAFDYERVWRTKRSEHLGLLGMRERVEMVGGDFTVDSAPGQGTTIKALLPFRNGTKELAPA
jgi:signal transduction histidine kinase